MCCLMIHLLPLHYYYYYPPLPPLISEDGHVSCLLMRLRIMKQQFEFEVLFKRVEGREREREFDI